MHLTFDLITGTSIGQRRTEVDFTTEPYGTIRNPVSFSFAYLPRRWDRWDTGQNFLLKHKEHIGTTLDRLFCFASFSYQVSYIVILWEMKGTFVSFECHCWFLFDCHILSPFHRQLLQGKLDAKTFKAPSSKAVGFGALHLHISPNQKRPAHCTCAWNGNTSENLQGEMVTCHDMPWHAMTCHAKVGWSMLCDQARCLSQLGSHVMKSQMQQCRWTRFCTHNLNPDSMVSQLCIRIYDTHTKEGVGSTWRLAVEIKLRQIDSGSQLLNPHSVSAPLTLHVVSQHLGSSRLR